MKKFSFVALAATAVAAAVFTGCKDPDPEPVKVSSVTFTALPSASLEIGDEFTFTVNVLPADAADKSLTWTSSAPAVVSVDQTGKAKALAAGEATVTATANDGSGQKAESRVTVDAPAPEPTLDITAAEGLSLAEVNEIEYSEAVDAGGKPAKELSVTVAASRGIASLKLKLTTVNGIINGALTQMGLADGFDLTRLPAGALDEFFGGGIPSGEAVMTDDPVKLDFSALLPLVAGIPGGIEQFDIDIEVSDAIGTRLAMTEPPRITKSETLKLKFIDDVIVSITGDGIGEEPLEIKASEATGETPVPVVVNVAAPQGIAAFRVKIDSSSAAFTGGLAAFGLGEEVDLANPGEELAGNLAGLGEMGVSLPFGDQIVGKTELTFNVTPFVPVIFMMRAQTAETGDCTADFTLTVIDAKGTETVATVKLKLVDDTAGEGA
jgi:hypothetical protein